MKVLTTGVGSGFGRYAFERLGGEGLRRESGGGPLERLSRHGVDLIVHCAEGPRKGVTDASAAACAEDGILLTKRLVDLPHEKFVYFSTVDIYPRDGGLHEEEETIRGDKLIGTYAVTKFLGEGVVRRTCENHLILRPTMMLGTHCRANLITRMLDGSLTETGLSGRSRFNYVLYVQVLEFIQMAVDRDLRGTYNVASSDDLSLGEVADLLGCRPGFGTDLYDGGNISNRKIRAMAPGFHAGSREILETFAGEYRRGERMGK